MADTQVAATSASILDLDVNQMQNFWSSDTNGVYIYIDANNDLVYQSTTDGGATRSAPVVIRTGTVVNNAAYYAQWNPALQSSYLIHLQYTDGNTMYYRTLDCASLVLGTERTITTDADMSSSSQYSNIISVSRNGDILVTEKVHGGTAMCFRSTDGGVNWVSRANPQVGESFTDADRMYVVTSVNTDDTADHAILYDDISANELSIKVYDSSGNVWNETVIGTVVESSVGVGTQQVSNVTRISTGKVMVLALNDIGSSANNDLLAWELTITSSAVSGVTVTALTTVFSNVDDTNMVSAVYDPATDTVHVAYGTGSVAGSELDNVIWRRSSTDWGTTWSSATQYSAGSSGAGTGYQQLSVTGLSSTGGVVQWMFWLASTTAIYINLDNDVPAPANPTIVLTGTLGDGANEDEVALGGLTLVATITAGGTWDSTVDDDAVASEDFIGALVSAGVEALGWNNVVVGKFYRREVLADSPLEYWRMGGTFTSLGSVGTTGTATSLTTGGALLLSSAQGSSVFNAALSKLAIGVVAGDANIWDGGGTAELVINPWASGFSVDGCRLFSKIDAGAGWELGLQTQLNGKVDIFLRVDFSGGQGVWRLNSKIPIGVQTHFAVTYNSSSASNDPTFYVNGQPYTPTETSTPSGTRSTDAASALWIGSNSSPALTFNGQMQEVALYTTSLSATRIQAHVLAASNRYGLRYSNLVRTSATVITLTMPAFPFYDITVAETVTATFPASTHSGSNNVVATPTFTITPTTRKITFIPPPNPFASQTPGPFGNVNGGLGPAAGDAFRILGAGDEWALGSPEMAIGLDGATQARIIQIVATEITELT